MKVFDISISVPTKTKTSRTTVLLFLCSHAAKACFQPYGCIKKSAQCSALVLVLVKPPKMDRNTVAILLFISTIIA